MSWWTRIMNDAERDVCGACEFSDMCDHFGNSCDKIDKYIGEKEDVYESSRDD